MPLPSAAQPIAPRGPPAKCVGAEYRGGLPSSPRADLRVFSVALRWQRRVDALTPGLKQASAFTRKGLGFAFFLPFIHAFLTRNPREWCSGADSCRPVKGNAQPPLAEEVPGVRTGQLLRGPSTPR